MAPRAYNNETRQQQQAELKQRIVQAAVQLHAAKGALATSYADIAQAAGVSLPTAYKHFPQMDELLQSCTAHVAQAAPVLPAEQILAAPDLATASLQLVEAMDKLNAHYEPWLVWREHERLKVLADITVEQRRQLTGLCAGILARHGHSDAAPELAPIWESLLNFELWHRLVREHKLRRAAVRESLHRLLLAVAGPPPATQMPSRPTRRKSP